MGKLTGAKWKNQRIMKAKIESRSPMNKTQINSRLAFEVLCRMAGELARSSWQYWSLDDSGMTRHNAISHFLKPIVADHYFQLSNISKVVPEESSLYISEFTFNRTAHTVSLVLGGSPAPYQGAQWKMYIGIYSEEGYPIDSRILAPTVIGYTVNVPVNFIGHLFCVSFIYHELNGVWNPYSAMWREKDGMKYSTTEQRTGDFALNGKPIYQITFNGFVPTPADAVNLTPLPANIEEYIYGWGNLKTASGNRFPISWPQVNDASKSMGVYYNGTNIRLSTVSTDYNGAEYWVTVQYTKTTDAATTPVPKIQAANSAIPTVKARVARKKSPKKDSADTSSSTITPPEGGQGGEILDENSKPEDFIV